MIRRVLIGLILLFLLAGCAAPQLPTSTEPLDTGVDPQAWADVPAGEFLYGMHEQPVEIAYDYQIMVTDVTNAQFAAYLNAALASGSVKISGDQVVGYYPGDPFHGKKHEEPIEAGDWPHFPIQSEGSRLTYDGQAFEVMPGY